MCFNATTPVDERVCRRGYPLPLMPVTTMDEHGYPHYRRRRERDRTVVPHNRKLLSYFDCHISVERALSVACSRPDICHRQSKTVATLCPTSI